MKIRIGVIYIKRLSFDRVLGFIHRHTVLTIALFLAVVTSFIVKPDREYIGYFDFKTLCCLFCTLAVVCALKNIRFFTYLSRRIVVLAGNLRSAVLCLVYITFIGSMLLANDMALITFLPLGYFVLTRTEKKEYMAFVFIMQNIAANLGGMLTPFGNPQNLYLYSYYKIPNVEFLKIMFPPFILSLIMIIACCFIVKKEPAEIKDDVYYTLDKPKTIIYLVLFALSVCSVLRVFPFYIGVGIATIGVLILDRKAFKTVNYPLLLTFCAFFVFSGNMSRIDAVHRLIGGLLDKNTLLVSVLSCQVISNVPSATLLCKFTSSYAPLLAGVNVGGLGTPIASLASLITLGKYKETGENTAKYLGKFLLVNFSFLIILVLFELFVVRV